MANTFTFTFTFTARSAAGDDGGGRGGAPRLLPGWPSRCGTRHQPWALLASVRHQPWALSVWDSSYCTLVARARRALRVACGLWLVVPPGRRGGGRLGCWSGVRVALQRRVDEAASCMLDAGTGPTRGAAHKRGVEGSVIAIVCPWRVAGGACGGRLVRRSVACVLCGVWLHASRPVRSSASGSANTVICVDVVDAARDKVDASWFLHEI